jgi:hypothetical protein
MIGHTTGLEPERIRYSANGCPSILTTTPSALRWAVISAVPAGSFAGADFSAAAFSSAGAAQTFPARHTARDNNATQKVIARLRMIQTHS